MNSNNIEKKFQNNDNSQLFNHYKKPFKRAAIEEFKVKKSAGNSPQDSLNFKKEIERHIEENVKHETKSDFNILGDTQKTLSEE